MRRIVLPYTRASVVGGIMLGLGRALGETMAVTFVIGNTNRISPSLFAPGNTIASLVALEFPEAESRQPATLLPAGARASSCSSSASWCWRYRARCWSNACGTETWQRHSMPRTRDGRALRWAVVGVVRTGWPGLLALLATLVALAFLASILVTLFYLGLPGLNPPCSPTVTKSPGSAGGLANAIVGSVVQTGIGTLVGTPIGLMVGTYLAEYAGRRRSATPCASSPTSCCRRRPS